MFFLEEEQSDGASEAWQVSQPVRACKPGLGPGGPVQANHTSIFLGVKLMFDGVMNFGQVQKIRFIVVKIFWSYSNPYFGHGLLDSVT